MISDVQLGCLHQLEISGDGSRIATSDTNHNTIVYSLYNDEIKVCHTIQFSVVLRVLGSVGCRFFDMKEESLLSSYFVIPQALTHVHHH